LIKKVTYTNTKTGDSYEFNNYENGSMATSHIEVDEENPIDSVVYKNIEGKCFCKG